MNLPSDPKHRTAAFFAVFLLLSQAASAANENLYQRFGGKSVKTYLEVKDSTQGKIRAEELEKRLLDALKERKSISFVPVDDASAADLTITADVIDYHWTDHDPIDMLVGVGGTAMDAAVVEDFARITVAMRICDAAGRECWKDRLTASITKKPMSEAESVPLVLDKFAKVFVREAFSKKSR